MGHGHQDIGQPVSIEPFLRGRGKAEWVDSGGMSRPDCVLTHHHMPEDARVTEKDLSASHGQSRPEAEKEAEYEDWGPVPRDFSWLLHAALIAVERKIRS